MSSVQEFKCVLCEDTFQSKEELQKHFRKHGDPNFGQPPATEKKKEEVEMVNCDVCPEMFPTISKAITHKHKCHPDHDAKHFCPWCGKLFTMKHLYNKHLQAMHPEDKRVQKFSFPCNSCNVDFFVASAMLYHNKFFHRQDTELPNIGHSKKIQAIGQELVLIYYCPFCGEEFNNKINLHKHMVEDHFDENQHPEDVLRCPLCDAIFYHLDAYELHLTFHSVEDMYNEKNDIIAQITEFSLEAVPPLMEKIENAPEEDYLDPIGLAQMLQLGMDDAGDSASEKKKRKKHKKSKKSAITLDEFLTMNQDVFGEGLDVEGIVEVPTQVVNNTLKRKKPTLNTGSKLSQADMQKLKKQGVIIKKKSNTPQPMNVKPQKIVNKPVKLLKNSSNVKLSGQNSPNAECNDAIAKLMNQSNSQIKIVKKINTNTPNKEINTPDLPQKNDQESGQDNSIADQRKNEIPVTEAFTANNEEEQTENPTATSNESINVKEKSTIPETKTDVKSSLDVLRKISQHLTVKPVLSSSIEKRDAIEVTVEHLEKQSNETNTNLSDHEDNALNNDEEKGDDVKNNDDEKKVIALQSLTKSVTIKSISPKICIGNKLTSPENTIDGNNDDIEDVIQDEEMSLSKCNNLKKPISPITAEAVDEKTVEEEFEDNDEEMFDKRIENSDDKPLNKFLEKHSLKNLSKFITVKSVSTKTTEIQPENIQKQFSSDSQKKPLTLNNYTEGSSGHEMSDEDYNNSFETEDRQDNLSQNKNLKLSQHKRQYSDEDEETKGDTITINNENSKTFDSIKRLSAQISIKQSSDPSKPVAQNNTTKSDHDPNNAGSSLSNKTDSSHLEALKKLGSNITLKSNKPAVKKNICKNEEINESHSNKKIESPSHVEALKKLGSNITLKSNNPPSSSNSGAIVKYNSNIIKNKPPVNKVIQNKESIKKSISTKSISNNINRVNTSISSFNQAVTTKSCTTSNFSQQSSFNRFTSKTVQKCALNESHHKSEILNIDDSDDEIISNLQKKQSPHLNKTIAVKKNRPGPACSKIGYSNNFEKDIKTEMDRAKAEMQNSLKKLGHNITIKSKNTLHFPDSPDNLSAPEEDWDEDGNSNNSKSDKIKIAEVTDDQESDGEIHDVQYSTVESPQHSDDDKDKECDFDDEINSATINKADHCTSQLKNLSKNITVKSLNRNQNLNKNNLRVNESQECKKNNDESAESHTKQCRQSNKEITQKSIANKANSVNKTTTSVKTFETETVIEEITTTVTKTIRTVNKSLNQNVSNANKTLSTNQIQSRTIQNVRPTIQPKNIRPPVRPLTSNTRPRMKNVESFPQNQLVPVRPRLNTPRVQGPRMQTTKMSAPQQSVPNKRLKIAPNVNLTPTVKRPAPEETSGPFSQFKKPKESLIPFDTQDQCNDSEQYSSACSKMEMNVSSTNIVKGNSTVTQIKNKAVSMSSHQIQKLGNVSGLKITKSSQCQKSSYSEVTNEVSPDKKSTLDAIQRLQKQGLIIKKPRVEEDNVDDENSDFDQI